MAIGNVGALSVKITADTTGIKRGLNETQKGLKKTSNSLTQSKNKFKEWSASSAVATVALSAAVTLTARAVVRMADSFTSVQNQIKQTTNSTEELTQRTQQLLEVANRSRADLSATGELFTQLTLNTEELGFSTEELLRITETIGKSFAVAGKSAQEQAGATRQLNQALAAGALRGDEFNSIAENAPEIQRALKRELGLTSGALREFAATGGITAEIIVKAMGNAAAVVDEKMNKSTETLAQSMLIASNNATVFVGSSRNLQGAMSGVGETVKFLANNLDVLFDVLTVVAVAGFTKLAISIGASTSAKITSIIATTALAKAEQQAAVSALAVARAEQIATVSMFNASAGAARATIASGALAAANNTLAASAARAAAANAALSGGGLALIGGGVGLAVLAAAAITAFALSASNAKDPAKELADQTNKLAESFGNLTKAQIAPQLANATTEVNKLESQLITASEALKGLIQPTQSGQVGSSSQISAQMEKITDLEGAITSATIKRDALFQAGIDAGGFTSGKEGASGGGLTEDDETAKANDAFAKRFAAIQEQTAKEANEETLRQAQADDAFASRFAKIQEQTALEKAEKDAKAQAVLEDLQRQTESATELENSLHASDLERLRAAMGDRITLTEEEQGIKERLEQKHQKALKDIQLAENDEKRRIFSRNADAVLGAISAVGGKSLKVQKAISLASAAVAISTGIARSSELGFPANIAEIARVVAVGASAISGIKSAKIARPSTGGGGGRSPASAPQQAAPSNRSIDVNFTGQGSLSMAEVRELIGQFNEALGDGAQLNVTGG